MTRNSILLTATLYITTFDVQKFCILPPERVYVFCVDLITNSIKRLVFITDTKCLLHCTNSVFK